MKRLVTLGITLALVMGLFCFSVNATATTITVDNTKSDTFTTNGVTCNIYGFQLPPNNPGGSTIEGSAYVPFYITMQVSNTNDSAVLLSRLGFTMSVTDGNGNQYDLYGIENYTQDLYLSGNQENIFYVSPSAGFSRAGNGIVVPPKKSLYLVCEVQIAVDLVVSSGSYNWPTVNWQSLSLRDFTSATGDYPYDGMPVQLDDIQILNDMLTSLTDAEADINTIRNVVNGILPNIIYTGTDPDVTYIPGSLSSLNKYNLGINNFHILGARKVGTGYPVYDDYEYNNTNDTSVSISTYRVPFFIYITFMNRNNKAIKTATENYIYGLFPNSKTIPVIDTYSSNIFNIDITPDSRVILHNIHPYLLDNNIIPVGVTYICISGHIDFDSDYSLTWPNMSYDYFNGNTTPTLIDGYYPRDEVLVLRDLYLAYSSVNGVGDLSDQSQSASDQMAAIHSQEASYYAQNQAAIEATGLNNFTFSNEQANGIGKVSSLFTQLWNALGSWNSVYVFSMTLTLALTILRHVPNRRKTKEKNSE